VTQASEALLDVAMIVKDEEGYLPTCLESLEQLRPILGVVHIYDTGSSDRTVEIARAWGAEVTEGYWDDDFARARNAAMALSSAPWVLIVDADERVSVETDSLESELVSASTEVDVDAFESSVLLRSDASYSSATSIRIFRRARVCYRNRVHERPVRMDGGDPCLRRLPSSTVSIVHIGYTSAAFSGKLSRNLNILEVEVEACRANESQAQLAEALLNRGRSLAGVGDVRAAERDFEEMRKLDCHPKFRLLGGERLAQLLLDQGRWDEVEPLLQELRQEGQDRDMTAWLWARLAIGRGMHDRALPLLRLVNRPKSAVGMVDSWAPVLRARVQAATMVGEYEEALAAAIPLLAKHGGGAGLGPLVVALWADRPTEALARLFAEFGPEHAVGVAAEMELAGEPGPQVASSLRQMIGLGTDWQHQPSGSVAVSRAQGSSGGATEDVEP